MKKNKKSSTLKLFYKQYQKIAKLPLSQRKKVLAQANGHPLVYKSFREIAKNVLNRNVKYKNAALVDLLDEKDVKYLKKINDKRNSAKHCTCSQRKKFIQEGAGIFGLLIPAIAALATLFMKK